MDTNWLPLVSFIVSLLAIPTLVGLFWKEIWNNRKSKRTEEKEKRREEFKDLVKEVVQVELKPLKEDVEELKGQVNLVADGTTSGLRNDIKDCFYRCYEKGYRTDYDTQNMYDLYESYHNLGGNSFVEDIMKRFDLLPPREDYAKKVFANEKVMLQNTHSTKNTKKTLGFKGGASTDGK